MAEIYRDDATKAVTLSVTGGTAVGVKFVRDGVETPATPTGLSAPIPYSITYRDGDFSAVWTYTIASTVYTRTDTHTVVTPYFTQAELIAHDPDMSAITVDQTVKLERLVRGIVDAYTGQSFGLEAGTLTCYGNNDTTLMTEKRVVSITSITESTSPASDPLTSLFRPVNGGYALERVEPGSSGNLKVLILSEEIFTDDTGWAGFRNNTPYLVVGTFGWDSVPFDVNLAALHLAEEFSCDETLWRDRYIKAIRGEGFDLEFRSDAFTGTGSVTADQLLGKYIANKLAII